jgi:hypothetical protein
MVEPSACVVLDPVDSNGVAEPSLIVPGSAPRREMWSRSNDQLAHLFEEWLQHHRITRISAN